MEMESIPARKAALRRLCLRRRQTLSPPAVAAASREIRQRVLALEEYLQARLVHTYVSSIANEVDTCELIQRCLEQDKRVVVPVVRRGTRVLAHVEIEGLEQLKPDAWGILSPVSGRELAPADLERIELVVTPGVAFDRQGHRLGLGGGYYDRFLNNIRAPKVGLIYDCLLVEEIPLEQHDALVDVVVTETAVHRPVRE